MGPRIIKLYDFSYKLSSINSTVVPGSKIEFTGYPGILSSIDDWFMINSGLTVSETTISNNNPNLYYDLSPNTVFTWNRAMVSNRLARDGKSWTKLIS